MRKLISQIKPSYLSSSFNVLPIRSYEFVIVSQELIRVQSVPIRHLTTMMATKCKCIGPIAFQCGQIGAKETSSVYSGPFVGVSFEDEW